jgi:hypothetical protein
MKLLASVAVLLVAAGGSQMAGWERGPLVVLEKLAAAQRSIDSNAAFALFSDDATIVNVIGSKFSGSQLNSFVEEAISSGDGFVIESPEVRGNTAAWTQAVTAEFYESIDVAPVTFAFNAAFEKGKIECIIAYFPSAEIARIENACRAQEVEPFINGGACSEFVRRAWTHTNFVSERLQQDDAVMCPAGYASLQSSHGRGINR